MSLGAEHPATAVDPIPIAGIQTAPSPGVEPPEPWLTAEHHFGWGDVAILVGVLLIAAVYLYRALWLRRGRCDECDCTSCPTAGPACPPGKTAEKPRRSPDP